MIAPLLVLAISNILTVHSFPALPVPRRRKFRRWPAGTRPARRPCAPGRGRWPRVRRECPRGFGCRSVRASGLRPIARPGAEHFPAVHAAESRLRPFLERTGIGARHAVEQDRTVVLDRDAA